MFFARTIFPETIPEMIPFQFLRCENYVTAAEMNSPGGPICQTLRYRNRSNPLYAKTICVMQSLRYGAQNQVSKNNVLWCNSFGTDGRCFCEDGICTSTYTHAHTHTMVRNEGEEGGGTLWAREMGTICPFGVFPLFYSNFWRNLRPIHVPGPIVVLWRFPLFYRHFRWFWGFGTPNPPFVLFGPENGLFKLPKHYVVKGN